MKRKCISILLSVVLALTPANLTVFASQSDSNQAINRDTADTADTEEMAEDTEYTGEDTVSQETELLWERSMEIEDRSDIESQQTTVEGTTEFDSTTEAETLTESIVVEAEAKTDSETIAETEESAELLGAQVSGSYEYTLDNRNEATITKYNGNEANLIIPDKLDGYTVIAIGDADMLYNSV